MLQFYFKIFCFASLLINKVGSEIGSTTLQKRPLTMWPRRSRRRAGRQRAACRIHRRPRRRPGLCHSPRHPRSSQTCKSSKSAFHSVSTTSTVPYLLCKDGTHKFFGSAFFWPLAARFKERLNLNEYGRNRYRNPGPYGNRT